MDGVSVTVKVPVPLLVVTSVDQVPDVRLDVYWTVIVLSAGAVTSKLRVPPETTGLVKLRVPEPLPPIVVKVKEVTVLRTEPAVYSGV